MWSTPCQDSETGQESTTSWKLTGCSWAFLNRSEKTGRELGWLDSEFGFSKGCKVTILPIFHFFDFTACKAAQEGYTVTGFCQDDVRMSQTRTAAVNVKCDLCSSLKLHKLSHCSIPCPTILCKEFRSIWNMLIIIFLHVITFISFLKHTSNKVIFRLAQVLASLQILLTKIWRNRHDVPENKTNSYCIAMAA